MEIFGAASDHILPRQKAGSQKKVMDRMKKVAVKMSDFVKKMSDHVPECFFRNHIFLSAYMAKATLHNDTTVKAVLFFAQWGVGHRKFFLKISTKKYKLIECFSLLNNSI